MDRPSAESVRRARSRGLPGIGMSGFESCHRRSLGARSADGGGKPIYKKWWFWGGVAVVGAGVVGTAVVLGSGGGGPPDTDLGNIDFGK